MITTSLKKKKKKKSQLGFHKNDATQTSIAVISSNKDIPQFGPYLGNIFLPMFLLSFHHFVQITVLYNISHVWKDK